MDLTLVPLRLTPAIYIALKDTLKRENAGFISVAPECAGA